MYNMLNKDVLLFCLCESVLVNHLLYTDRKRQGCLVKNTADKFFSHFYQKIDFLTFLANLETICKNFFFFSLKNSNQSIIYWICPRVQNVMHLFGFVCFLFLFMSGKGCSLWLWHSLDFSLTLFPLLLLWLSRSRPNNLNKDTQVVKNVH